jgi:hypothetical protein
MWQSYHLLLNINDLKNSRNDWNEIEVLVKIPVPARFRARDRKEFLRNFEPRNRISLYFTLLANMASLLSSQKQKHGVLNSWGSMQQM